MAKSPRENRVPIMMSDDELGAIDDWRFRNRVATRSEAVRRLVQLGLLVDSVRHEFLDILKAEASTERAFASAFADWMKWKGYPPVRLFGSREEEAFAEAYGVMLGQGAVRVEFVASLVKSMAQISRSDAEMAEVLETAKKAIDFYSWRLEEFADEREKDGK